MIPCCETPNGEIHARAGNKTLCGKEYVERFDISAGQWAEKDGHQPPLRWCKECEGFLTARGLYQPVVKVETKPVAQTPEWLVELIVEPVRKHSKGGR